VALLEEVAERLRADIERARAEATLRATQAWLQATHADLQRLLTALDTARDAERLRISRELHDELLQSLAGMLLEAGAARLSLGQSQPDLRASLARLEDQARGLIASTRRIIQDLRPLVIEELGLVAALESLVSQLPDLGGPVGSFDARSLNHADEQRLAPMAASIYRIAQEALTNVVRHAHARHAQLVMASDAGGVVRLTITDDGAGMPTPPPKRTDGFGLIGMQERVRALGGTLQLHAGAEGGTVVTVTIPLP
jgi:signal transduction histidine kinase